MPETTPEPTARENTIKVLTGRVTELERTVKALLEGLAAAESDRGVDLMPEGEYYGKKFS